MASADQQFSLAEILSQTYGVREECEEAVRRPEQREEGPDKDFVSQVARAAPLGSAALVLQPPVLLPACAGSCGHRTGQTGSCLQGLWGRRPMGGLDADPAILSVWPRSPLCSWKWPRVWSS